MVLHVPEVLRVDREDTVHEALGARARRADEQIAHDAPQGMLGIGGDRRREEMVRDVIEQRDVPRGVVAAERVRIVIEVPAETVRRSKLNPA